MKFVYIKETNQTCDIIKRIILKIKYFFNIIDIKTVQNKIIYLLPIYFNKNINEHRINKISKKIISKLEKDGVRNIILSKYIGTIKQLKNNLYSANVNILDGRYLFKCLSYDIINYISKRKNEDIKTSEITILVNDFSDINKELIIYIAQNVKTVNIVTNYFSKCKNIENYLYNEFGILLNISNNKKICLSNSKVILNFDFPEEVLNQYKIYNKAIIINILGKVPIQSKKFSGLNINYFKIDIPEEYKIDCFDNEIIYEQLIYKNNLYNVMQKISSDKIKIKKLIGNSGAISNREFSNV